MKVLSKVWQHKPLRHSPSKVLRAVELEVCVSMGMTYSCGGEAYTAMSTSFSEASCTEQMGFSVLGLMVSKVLPSTDLTNSPPMKRPVGCSYLLPLGRVIVSVSDIVDW